MVEDRSIAQRLFQGLNYVSLIGLSLLCIFPLVHIFAISLSDGAAVNAGLVKLWPVNFTTISYEYVMSNDAFLESVLVSLKRIAIGVTISMLINILCAYPLSKGNLDLSGRTIYVWIFVFSMLFHGGLIPTFLIVKELHMLDTIWALTLPNAVMVFNIVLMLNFFRNLPKELEEAAFMDGAGHWSILIKIYLPLSMPSIATILLFTIVYQWNEWFYGIIFMNRPENYPLASYLQTVLIRSDMIQDAALNEMAALNDRTAKAAQIFLGALPVLAVYPFLQKYFAKGITLGSVKE